MRGGSALPQGSRTLSQRGDHLERRVSGARLESQDVEEAANNDLTWADAIVFCTPTRYGLPRAQPKQFLDMTGARAQDRLVVHQHGHSARWAGNDDRQSKHDVLSFGSNHCGAGVRRPDSVPGWQSLRRIVYEQQWALKSDEVALAARGSKASAFTEVAAQFPAGRRKSAFFFMRCAESEDSFPYSGHSTHHAPAFD
jgi:hypothetical protein